MSEIDKATKRLNEAADKATLTTNFFDELTTAGNQSDVTNPNNNKTVPSVSKQVIQVYEEAGLNPDAISRQNQQLIRNLGEWRAGLKFENKGDYATYNDQAIVTNDGTPLPYTTQGADPTAAPDAGSVVPFAELTFSDIGTAAPRDVGDFIVKAENLETLKALPMDNLTTGDGARITMTGRAGDFYWDSSDLRTEVASDAQEGVYVAPEGQDGANGAWRRDMSASFVTPDMFGAVGDGITDDSDAFDGFFTVGEGHLFIPNKIYYKPRTHTLIGSDRYLLCEGWLTGNPGTASFSCLTIAGSNVVVDGLKIDEQSVEADVKTSVGTQTSLDINTSPENVTIKNLIIKNSRQNGIYPGCENLIIDGFVIENCGEHGIYYNLGPSREFTNKIAIKNGVIDGYGVRTDYLNTNAQGIKIRDCMYPTVDNVVIRNGSAAAGKLVDGVYISTNYNTSAMEGEVAFINNCIIDSPHRSIWSRHPNTLITNCRELRGSIRGGIHPNQVGFGDICHVDNCTVYGSFQQVNKVTGCAVIDKGQWRPGHSVIVRNTYFGVSEGGNERWPVLDVYRGGLPDQGTLIIENCHINGHERAAADSGLFVAKITHFLKFNGLTMENCTSSSGSYRFCQRYSGAGRSPVLVVTNCQQIDLKGNPDRTPLALSFDSDLDIVANNSL